MKNYENEYNKVKVTNEDTNMSFEFGNTPVSETESFPDNENNIRDEVNDNPTSNTTKVKEESKRQDKEETKVEETSQSTSSTSTSSSSASSSSASSSAASSAAGAASTAAVVAASTIVAVASIGSLVGIGPKDDEPTTYGEVTNAVIANYSNKIGYRFDLITYNNDRYNISLYEGDALVANNALQKGTNANYFTSLKESTEYKISVYNTSRSNYLLYSYEVSTLAADEANIIIDPVADMENGTFDVLVTFNVNDRNFGGFVLNLTNAREETKDYFLDRSDSQQSILLNQDGDDFIFDFNDPDGFNYSLYYLYGEEQERVVAGTAPIIFNTTAVLKKHKITLNPGDSKDDAVILSLREGSSFTLPECPFNPPEGYKFKGWKASNGYVYDPGLRMISYLDKDYTYTAVYKVDDTPIFNSITFTNEIDFTQAANQIEINMDYSDPSRLLYSMTFTIYNPNEEYREAGHNFVETIYATENQTITIYTTEYLDFTSGQQFEYKFTYIDYERDVEVEAASGFVTFVDKNGGEAHVDSFQILGTTHGENTGYTVYWTSTYTDTFENGFYSYPIIEFTPLEGGNPITVYSRAMPVEEVNMTFNGEDYPDLDFNSMYTYVYKVVDKSGNYHRITEGTINFATAGVYLNNPSIHDEYYSVNSRIYIDFTATINDPNGLYGDLFLELTDNRDENNPVYYNYKIAPRDGRQIIDVTDFPLEALETEGYTLFAFKGDRYGYIVNQNYSPALFESITSTLPDIKTGTISNHELDASNLYFSLEVIKTDGISGSMSNPRLIIDDTYTINFDVSYISTGISYIDVMVPQDDNYIEIREYLLNHAVTIKLQYDILEYGSVDSSPSIILCSDTVFTVK